MDRGTWFGLAPALVATGIALVWAAMGFGMFAFVVFGRLAHRQRPQRLPKAP